MGRNMRHRQHHHHQGTPGTLHNKGMKGSTTTLQGLHHQGTVNTTITNLVVTRATSMMGTHRLRLLLNRILLPRFTTVSIHTITTMAVYPSWRDGMF